MLIGYARVSTQDQHLRAQTDALKQAGCEKVYTDQLSGASRERPGLTQALETLRKGDTLVVWKSSTGWAGPCPTWSSWSAS